jgi:TadE-like protein
MSLIHSFLKDDSGEATIEFVFVFPIVFLIFTASFESSMFMAKSVMFDRAVDKTVRKLRLGTLSDVSHEDLKEDICRSGMLIGSLSTCVDSLKIWMQPVNTGDFQMAAPPRTCVDKNQPINTNDPPANEFAYGSDNDIMLMRVCLKEDPIFPTTLVSLKMPVDTDGSAILQVTTTFVNEPG